ncbi:hypothetical protein J8273_6111 [Carpediemonas membranifera]|uniref:Uncharacterized protein n=1 Tax=Carpediemonas membranifera TaxID=201153 RepID=A0A8J6B006_9EUKA|nr:hypothetical protein J8273_6111 [Carpediemonas membranifera]|eukprot:KAG9392568.1 hypothetical protein J8273_6111 [Carpediemonas membranifera]
MIRYDLKDGIVRLIRAVQLFKSELKQMGDAAQEIAELKATVQQLQDAFTAGGNVRETVDLLRQETTMTWKRPASSTMREEAEFLEEIYRSFKFNRISGFAVLARIFLRHRVLWVKDRYGYLAASAVSTAGMAALAERHEMNETEIETLVLRTPVQDPPPDREEHQARHRT